MYNKRVINIGVSPSGKASDSDSDMRKFESYYPNHYLKGISKKDKKEDFIVLFLKWNKLYFTSLQMALNQGLSSLVTFLLH